MRVACLFGRVKTYFLYFSENYVGFAISGAEVRFLSILGRKKKNALARAGGEPGCLLYLWISLGFSSENQEKSGNQWKSGSEEKKNLSRLKNYKGGMNLVKTTNQQGSRREVCGLKTFPGG